MLPNHSQKDPLGEGHVEDLLGPAMPPRMSTNLIERLAEQQEGLRREVIGQRS
jgi:hypothetical protein